MGSRWLSIFEYSQYRNISISTIRRYIKSDKVKYKCEAGKYYIYVSSENWILRDKKDEASINRYKSQIKNLEQKVKELSEENSDLQMLLMLYESKKNTSLDKGLACH